VHGRLFLESMLQKLQHVHVLQFGCVDHLFILCSLLFLDGGKEETRGKSGHKLFCTRRSIVERLFKWVRYQNSIILDLKVQVLVWKCSQHLLILKSFFYIKLLYIEITRALCIEEPVVSLSCISCCVKVEVHELDPKHNIKHVTLSRWGGDKKSMYFST